MKCSCGKDMVIRSRSSDDHPFYGCSSYPRCTLTRSIYHASSGDLQAARESAIWLDATEADLTAPGLTMRLEARLPAVMEAFREAVESLGMIY